MIKVKVIFDIKKPLIRVFLLLIIKNEGFLLLFLLNNKLPDTFSKYMILFNNLKVKVI